MEPAEPLPEWNLDENDTIGMTQYRYKDLPQWAKEQLKTLPPRKQHKHSYR